MTIKLDLPKNTGDLGSIVSGRGHWRNCYAKEMGSHMTALSRERILYLLKAAEQEMVHGDYVPNIPERKALCELALACDTWRAEALAARKMIYGSTPHGPSIRDANNYDKARKAAEDAGLR